MSVNFIPELPNSRLRVRIAWGADLTADPATWTWTDITTDVQFSGPVTITPMGTADEFTQAQPAGLSFKVNNSTGGYSKGRQSPNYPSVRRNTPVDVAVSLDSGSTWNTRFSGNITGFTPSTITTGKVPMVVIKANGVTRRLGLRNAPLVSPLRRAVTDAPPAYAWLFDAGSSVTQAPEFSGGPTMSPAVFGPLDPASVATFGAASDLAGTTAAAKVKAAVGLGTNAYNLTANIPPYANTGYLAVGVWVKLPADPDPEALAGLTCQLFYLGFGGSGAITYYVVNAFDNGPAEFAAILNQNPPPGSTPHLNSSSGSTTNPFDGRWHYLFLSLAQNGSNIDMVMKLDGVTVATTTGTSLTLPIASSLTLSNQYVATGITPDTASYAVAAIWTSAASVTDLYAPGTGYLGETATARLTRVCGENGVPLVLTGSSVMPMGPQPIDALMPVLRECETTDGGRLYDGRGTGLGYIALSSRYNASAGLTLDASLGQVGDPFSPVDDDLGVKNRVTVKSKSGGQVVAEDVTGPQGTDAIGPYDVQTTVNPSTDTPLANIAGWQLHLGTVDEPYRYPQLSMNFRAIPSLADEWLALPLLGRIDVTSVQQVTSQYPGDTISLILEGYAETLSPKQWTVVANCSPAQPWQVGALNQSLRLEMSGQTLASGLAHNATTLSLATAAGKPLFTTAGADFPQYLNVAGWPVRVTAASGASSPQTLTIDPAPNTTTIPSTMPVTLWRPVALAL